MTHLDLSEEQAGILKETLEVVLSNMSVEIADTDRKAFRDGLKSKRDQLQDVLKQLT